jgi:uncharacterized protein
VENNLSRNDQLGLVAYLAKKWGPTDKLGRKAFQKIVHIATELGDVPTGYRFSFYTYGPYSRELAADLEYAEAIGAVSSSVDGATGAYDIKAGKSADKFVTQANEFLAIHFARLDKIYESFAGQSARSLELYSTLIFLESREPQSEHFDESIVSKVKQLKPKYTRPEIEHTFKKLKEISVSISHHTA